MLINAKRKTILLREMYTKYNNSNTLEFPEKYQQKSHNNISMGDVVAIIFPRY